MGVVQFGLGFFQCCGSSAQTCAKTTPSSTSPTGRNNKMKQKLVKNSNFLKVTQTRGGLFGSVLGFCSVVLQPRPLQNQPLHQEQEGIWNKKEQEN